MVGEEPQQLVENERLAQESMEAERARPLLHLDARTGHNDDGNIGDRRIGELRATEREAVEALGHREIEQDETRANTASQQRERLRAGGGADRIEVFEPRELEEAFTRVAVVFGDEYGVRDHPFVADRFTVVNNPNSRGLV